MKHLLFVTVCILTLIQFGCNNSQKEPKTESEERNGLVPNKETAIKVAEAIWLPIFGEDIYRKKPFNVSLVNDSIWIVQGTLHSDKGGVPYIKIKRKDCKILAISHSK